MCAKRTTTKASADDAAAAETVAKAKALAGGLGARELKVVIQNGNGDSKPTKTTTKKKPEKRPAAKGQPAKKTRKPAQATSQPATSVQSEAGANGQAQADTQVAPAKPPKPPEAKLSAADQMRLLRDRLTAKSGLAQTIKESDEVRRNAETFADALEAADTFGVSQLSYDKTEVEAEEMWYGLDWAGMEKMLKEWADAGGDASATAQAVLDDLNAVRGIAPLAWQTYWKTARDFIRPARGVRHFGELIEFLDALKRKGLADRKLDLHHAPDCAVRIQQGPHVAYYTPRAENPDERNPRRVKYVAAAEAGWPFVLKARDMAEGKAQERQARMDKMAGKATPGLTPVKVDAGQQGMLWVRVAAGRGALLNCAMNGTGTDAAMECCITEVNGFRNLRTPSHWFEWSAPKADWPNDEIYEAVASWRRRTEVAQQRTQEVMKVLDQAGLPTDPQSGSVTGLVTGKKAGVAAFALTRFQWPFPDGPRWDIGLVLKREKKGRLQVLAVKAIPPRDDLRTALESLAGENFDLAVEQTDRGVRVVFAQAPLQSGVRAEARDVMRIAIQMQMRLEERATAKAEKPAPAEQPAQ